MMGQRERARRAGRYPPNLSSRKDDPLAVRRSPRPGWSVRGRGSGEFFEPRRTGNPQPRGAPSDDAARHPKSRQGYDSVSVPAGPHCIKSRTLRFLGLKESSSADAERESSRRAQIKKRHQGNNVTHPARSLRRGERCNDSEAVAVEWALSRSSARDAGLSGRREASPTHIRTAVATARAARNMRESAYAKGKVRSAFAFIFKGGLITRP